ncbi:MAG: hypothetical protein IOMNBAOH_00781 [Rhodocyclaceae bacterium]|nr:flagellar biosynthesis anti-sigma factor FlgM [Rhodocyclaceae bacterium]MCG3186226.1 hypothetical protein [Rhodocyclaceae bacterium]
MKIDNNKPVNIMSVGGARTGAQRPAAASGSGQSEQVELSPMSARLKDIEAALANEPVVDRARVDEIKQAITEGRFQVDASKVADSLIQSVRDLIAHQRQRS